MSGVPNIGGSEWYVLKALWERSPLSGAEIVEAVSRDTDWSQSTILTMVRRLVQKKAIGIVQEKIKKYYPLVEESELKRHETSQFLKRVHKGSVSMLLRGFIEDGQLSKEDIEELKKLLDGME